MTFADDLAILDENIEDEIEQLNILKETVEPQAYKYLLNKEDT